MSLLSLLMLRRLLPMGALPALGWLWMSKPAEVDSLPEVLPWLWTQVGGDAATAVALGILLLALISLFGGRLLPRLF